jgi:hypothetical protein
MNRWLGWGAVALAVGFCSIVWADVVPPGRTNSGRVVLPVVIRRGIRGENGNVQAKVVIPRYLLDGALESYRGAKVKPTAKDEVGEAPAEKAPAPGEAPAAGGTPLPAPPKAGASATPPWGRIIAGIAMSLAAVSAVFVMRGRGTKTAAAVLVAGSVVLGTYAVGWADVAVPRRGPEIVIQLVDDANEVTLLLR